MSVSLSKGASSTLNGDDAVNDSGTVIHLRTSTSTNGFLTPALQEIEKEVGQLKNNKIAGFDHGSGVMLLWVITKMLEVECFLEKLLEGIVCPINKRGDKPDC